MHTKTLLKIKWVPKQLKSQREREAERNRVWAVVITHLVRTNYMVMAVKQYSHRTFGHHWLLLIKLLINKAASSEIHRLN